jgi:hypothetical protein
MAPLGNRVPLAQLARCDRGGVRASIALRWRRDRVPHTDPNRKAEAMGLFSKDIKTMNDLFVHTLRDIYYAENQILKALPEMIEKATDAQLKQAFQSHLAETKNQVSSKKPMTLRVRSRTRRCSMLRLLARRRPSSTTRSLAMEP